MEDHQTQEAVRLCEAARPRVFAAPPPARRLLWQVARMLRITRQNPPNGRPTFVLEGRLVGPWVAELRRTVGDVEGKTSIDLAGVTFADSDGVAALRALRRAGTDLVGASGFLVALLGGDDGADRTLG